MIKIKKIFTKPFIIGTVICLMTILEGVIVYNHLPNEVATHFTFSGVPNGYSSKNFAVFFLPLILTAIHFFIALSIEYSQKDKYKSRLYKALCSWLAPVLSVAIQTSVILFALGINITQITFILITLYILLLIFTSMHKETK